MPRYTVFRRNGEVSRRTQGLVGEDAARYECFYGRRIRSPNRTRYAHKLTKHTQKRKINDEERNDEERNELGRNSTSMLPLQTAPVNRRLVASALSGQDGVVPSFDWGKLASIVGQALPGIVSLF
jgi:hypothetical protein